jgi:transglutaminase-like putative cysteine protease
VLLRQLNASLYHWFDYDPRSTHVNSPIDEALESRKGVCQDFAHTMIALVRHVGIPCRYVSGYLYHGEDNRPLHGGCYPCLGGGLFAPGGVGRV